MVTRRSFLSAGGLALAGLAAPNLARAILRPPAVLEIRMRSDPQGAHVWFEPLGAFIEPGTRVRWILAESVHSTAAYHPVNDRHSLRIPESAEPWDSGILVQAGAAFEVRLTEPGVYDYFCLPHEQAGMVGRLVVGAATGPGALPFDYFLDRRGTSDWRPVPPAARRAFPEVERILREKIVRHAHES
ncbi:MAG TPA: plastocyanin/azurin family copper-binding protein [Gemmatimonadota bacterium]|nr:plastocyanin/azurin family copper-binding protein [Gemmatimonadota bacterium]